VITVKQYFWLNNWHYVVLLADTGVTSKRVGVRADTLIGWDAITNSNDCTPLGKLTACRSVGSHALWQTVEPLGYLFAVKARQVD
jgi:hypothetical protein